MNTSDTKNSPKRLDSTYTVSQAIVNYYLVIMFTVFPLFFTDAYFNIRHDKYYFFLVLSLFAVVAVGIIVLTPKLSRYIEKTNSQAEYNISSSLWYKRFSFTDWAVIVFWIVNFLSTIFSRYINDSLFGTAGRNNGLLLITFYAAVYFLITRSFKFKDYIFIAFAAGSSLVFLLSVLNCFYIDPLGMFKQLELNNDSQSIINFTSTIGNKNLMSSFICIALPVMIAMSVYENRRALSVLYYTASALGFTALMTADSDSGILGIGVFLAIFLIWYSTKLRNLKRYFLNITVMLASAKILRLFSLLFSDKTTGLDAFQEFFVFSNSSYLLLAAVALITVVLFVIDFKKPNLKISKAVPITIGVIFALGVVSILSAVFYFSVIDTKTDLNGLETIFRFNEKWGTHRGYMWIKSMEIFSDASLSEKLIGTGPDTFYYAFSPYFQGLMEYGDSSTNAAHNEYINYLITIGILGLASYVAIVGGCIVRAVKYFAKNPILAVTASAVICYSIQAVVNISQPITTPLFFIFIALCEAFCRNTANEQQKGT